MMLVAGQVFTLATPAISHAQSSTTTKPKTTSGRPLVDEGQSYYEQSRFDDAITLLKDLVDQGKLQGAELQRARELLARSYVKKGYPVQGKEMFKSMLQADSTYRPDPIRVPPDEAAVFEDALKEYNAERAAAAPVAPTTTTPKSTPPPSPDKIGVASSASGEKKKGLLGQWWFWAGAAAVVGGVAVAAGGGGGGDDKPPADTSLQYFPNTP